MVRGIQVGRSGEVQPGQGLSLSGILGGIGDVIGGIVPGGGVINTGIDILTGRGRGGGTGITSFSGTGCPTGFVFRNGRCEKTGLSGFGERVLPGGGTGVLPSQPGQGEAVMGSFGLPAMQPAQVGTITRNDGTVGPILRCAAGMVLGRDDLCYPRAILGRRSRFRKHKLAPRPPVTAADAKAIRRAERVRGKVRSLAKDVGFTCKKR